jgi:hypothetical protein
MDLNQVITLLWGYSRAYWTPGEASLMLAVLACNLQGTAPTLNMLEDMQVSGRTKRDARSSLAASGLLCIAGDGKMALAPFKMLISSSEGPPKSGGVVPKSGELPPRLGDVSPTPSRAVVAVQIEKENSSSSALTADLKQSVNPSSARARELADFAKYACLIDDDDDGIFQVLQKHGDALTCQALEQYQHNYTRRGRRAQRPIGQLLAWCKTPAMMDVLPPHAVTVAAWLARREAITTGKQTSAGLPSNAPDPATAERNRAAREKKAAEDKAKAEAWAAKCEPLADRFTARPADEHERAAKEWSKSRMFSAQLFWLDDWIKKGRPPWRTVDTFAGCVRDAMAIAESFLTGTPGKF